MGKSRGSREKFLKDLCYYAKFENGISLYKDFDDCFFYMLDNLYFTEVEKKILSGYYLESLTNEGIAELVGLSETRVSFLKTSALRRVSDICVDLFTFGINGYHKYCNKQGYPIEWLKLPISTINSLKRAGYFTTRDFDGVSVKLLSRWVKGISLNTAIQIQSKLKEFDVVI